MTFLYSFPSRFLFFLPPNIHTTSKYSAHAYTNGCPKMHQACLFILTGKERRGKLTESFRLPPLTFLYLGFSSLFLKGPSLNFKVALLQFDVMNSSEVCVRKKLEFGGVEGRGIGLRADGRTG